MLATRQGAAAAGDGIHCVRSTETPEMRSMPGPSSCMSRDSDGAVERTAGAASAVVSRDSPRKLEGMIAPVWPAPMLTTRLAGDPLLPRPGRPPPAGTPPLAGSLAAPSGGCAHAASAQRSVVRDRMRDAARARDTAPASICAGALADAQPVMGSRRRRPASSPRSGSGERASGGMRIIRGDRR